MTPWTGCVQINCREERMVLQDIFLTAPSLKPCPVNSNVLLDFLSLVDTNCVPLHLVAGSSWLVHTTNKQTERWMEGHLLGHLEVGEVEAASNEREAYFGKRGPLIQSRTGVLVKAEGLATLPNGLNVTELLLYAALSWEQDAQKRGMLTPPGSSSPADDQAANEVNTNVEQRFLQVYALPLSSDLDMGPLDSPPAISIPAEIHGNANAQFLGPSDFLLSEENPRKRQRLDSIFSNYGPGRKRLHKPSNSGTILTNTVKLGSAIATQDPEPERVEMLVRKKPKSSTARPAALARSHTIGSIRDLERPSSRNAHLARVQRSSLHKVTSSSPGSPETDAGTGNIESRNKNALGRVIMAGMRMYGLSQQNHRKRSNSYCQFGPDTPTLEVDGGDDYKMIYHQTYKAAAFALRRRFTVDALGPEILQETADRLLAMFCTDALEEVGPTDGEGGIFHGFGIHKALVKESIISDSGGYDNG